MRRFSLLASLLTVAALVFAAVADAHFLTKKRARNASVQVAKKECNEIPTCEAYGAGPCERLTPHRVRCDARVRDPLAECEFRVLIRLSEGGQLFYRRTPEQNWNCHPR
jgi:hypothetical protein